MNVRIKKTSKYEFRYGEANEVAVLEGEEWKPYESAWVSSLGRFKSSRGVVSTPKPKKSGYVSVMINGKVHQLHRLIAIAFDLPKEDDQDTVDHIDNDPSNNRKENLKWANGSEQIERSHATNEERGSSGPKLSKEDGQLRVSVWAGERGGRAGGRRVEGHCYDLGTEQLLFGHPITTRLVRNLIRKIS